MFYLRHQCNIVFPMVFILFVSNGPLVQAQTFTPVTTGPVVPDWGGSLGGAWGDYDNDGDLDLFVPNKDDQNNFLYTNNGNGTFTKVTNGPVVNDGGNSMGSSWGDYYNDGDLDLFVANRAGQNNFLYTNNGDGTLTKVNDGPVVTNGGISYGGSWGDYDSDGDLDLFVANYSNRNNFLYANNGDGSFTPVTTGPVVTNGGNSLGGSWGDIDNDGDLDLVVANTGTNFLYTNNGNGTFTKVTTGPVISDAHDSQGASWGDYDNDGDLDLFVTNWLGDNNSLYSNNGNGTFTKVNTGPVVSDGGNSSGNCWGDYDNDGDLDLFVANYGINFLYANNGDGTFAKVSSGPIVTDEGSSAGAAWGDFNNDGSLDLYVANVGPYNLLYANNGNANHWINLALVGEESNVTAIGAKVRLRATIAGSPIWQLNEISGQTGGAYSGQNSLNAEFGLGGCGEMRRLLIPSVSSGPAALSGIRPTWRWISF